MDQLTRKTRRRLAKKTFDSLLNELEEADTILEKVANLGDEAYQHNLMETGINKDFQNLGDCTLLADKWIKTLGKKPK